MSDSERYHDAKIQVTILDTLTGRTAESTGFDFSPYWWAEGNGSCDCNRSGYFEDGRSHLPPDTPDGCCIGAHRFLIIGVKGDPAGIDLWEFNTYYLPVILQEHAPDQFKAMLAARVRVN